MLRRYLALALVVTFVSATLPALAEDAALPTAPSPTKVAASTLVLPAVPQQRLRLDLTPSYAKTTFAFPYGQSQPTAPSKSSESASSSKQWTHGGKVMTVIGAGLIAGGAAMIPQGNSNISCSGDTCTQMDWRDTGIGFAAAGAVLLVIGLTRRH